MDIESIFNEVSIQMRSDLEKSRRAMNHAGLKGTVLEETFKMFLREYLPGSLDVSSGQVVDSFGGVSKQLDIIVSDSRKTPVFYRQADIRIVPVECVYAVIEVKAFLDKNELEKCYNNMKSVKLLNKSAFNHEIGISKKVNMYGNEWDIWPINYYVFAYESSGLRSITLKLLEMQGDDILHQRIDTICVLDKGVVTNCLIDGRFNALPEPGSSIKYNETKKSLLLFHTLLSRYMNQVYLPNFRFNDYVQNIVF